MRLIRAILYIFIFSLLFLPVTAFASEDFHVAIVADYTYNAKGNLHVRQQISLTNETSTLYANSYQLTVEGDTPKNLSGFDARGPLKITVTTPKDSSSTRLDVYFNEPAVGRGNTQRFTLEYDSKPAVKNGLIWDIVLPKLSQSQLIDSYLLNLYVPPEFGNPGFITPSPSYSGPGSYSFTKDQISQSGVVAAFGKLQTFDFTFTYHLINDSSKPATRTITLPPDTSYQKIYYDQLSPLPENVVADPDGNWVANYFLQGKQSLDVTAVGQVNLYAQPGSVIMPPPSTSLDEYIRSEKYWETTDPSITQLAGNLPTVDKIYAYVVNYLSFNRNALLNPQVQPQRRGAVSAMKSPQESLCTEFTDLFITLARANGIPARRLVGFAYTTDPILNPLSLAGNLLHTWPEYWDNNQQTWISVDPTWTDSSGGIDYLNSFDMNHFVFAIHGLDSENPYPVGLYPTQEGRSTFQVNFAPYRHHLPQFPETDLLKPFAFLPFIKNKIFLQIRNNQGWAIYKLPVNIASSGMELTADPGTVQPVLPPFSRVEIPIIFKPALFPDLSSQLVHIKLSDRTLTYNIPQKIFFVWYAILIIISSGFVIGLAALAVHAGSVHLQRSKRLYPLRRKSQKS